MANPVLNLIIGSYTTNGTEGIYVYRFNTENGELSYLNRTAVGIDNPTYLCVAANNRFIYSVNEVGVNSTGGISAFSFDPVDGTIHLLNTQPSGPGPCYISVDKAQKHVFAANYEGGSVYAFPINTDGSLGKAKQIIQLKGSGPDSGRQEKSHVHIAMLSPDENHLLYTDLGDDTLHVYRYNPNHSNILTPLTPSATALPPGDGPRHVAFTPNHKYLYLVSEMGGNVFAYDYNNGQPQHIQTISMLAEGFDGEISGGDIHISPNGRFVYASNRGDANEIIVFKINPLDGKLTLVQRQSSGGKEPRNFVIDPAGNYLLVANQKENKVVVFTIDAETGALLPTPIAIEIDSPSCLKFTPIN
ncbi:lactonase family protein [Mucilaginibacter terrae]|uniref:6-phosphogluconolactonase n=1 Tax=Mucilaginibacter terrae TaxID=1955052 RepID=A0ABU3GX70_9SPHI|nr:lactonase family protein [Mucilaginibacter terrae]MDT3404363.1 6-phosphogluconolactonase [Mucilaginibacter terrae]